MWRRTFQIGSRACAKVLRSGASGICEALLETGKATVGSMRRTVVQRVAGDGVPWSVSPREVVR